MPLFKSISRFLTAGKPTPALYLSAFGKHPGWNDHIDDLGLDTNALVSARTLLYAQGISQNIDSGAWDKLDATDPAAPSLSSIARLDLFRHDFLWSMHDSGGGTGDANVLLAGRLWSSSDGKGRDKYPMVLCAQLTEMPDRFATNVVLPFLAKVHEKCLTANSAETIRQLISHEREELRSHIKDSLSIEPLAPRQLAAIANHPDMHTAAPTPAAAGPVDGVPVTDPAAAIAASASPASAPVTTLAAPPSPLRATAGEGFHRIVYQFARGMSAFRTPTAKSTSPRRPEQVRLPSCGMCSRDALLFWMRFAYTFVDPSTPMLLFAPDQVIGGTSQTGAPWVDLIAGDPGPSNLFCIKAGTKSLPFTSDIPYTIDPSLVRAIDNHIAHCGSMADSSPIPPWPMFQ